jgi:hypothetical protein
MIPLRYRFLLFLALVLGVMSCRKDRPQPSWDIDVLAPLLIDTVFITDVISDTLITVNPDLSVSFVFEDKLYEARVDSLVRLPDTLISWEFDLQYLPFPINLQPGDTIISEAFDWPLDIEDYNIQGVKLVEGLIRSGQLVFEVLDESETDLLCVFGIRSAIKNETDTFRLEEKVLNGEIFSGSYDISDYRLGLTGEEGDTVNMLSYYLALIVHPDEPGQVTLYPEDKFSVDLRFENITLDYVLGYFGQNIFTIGPDETDVDLFGDLDVKGLSVEQMNVELEIRNYFGLEGYLNINQLSAINSSTGQEVFLQSEMVDSNLFIDRALDVVPGEGEVEPSIHTYDFSNSNFGELFSLMPDKIAYTMGITTNVYGDSTNYNNFFYYDEPIRVFMKASIDQGIRIDDLLVTSTVDWNTSGVELDRVREGHLVMVYTNGFPLSLDVEMVLLDEDENVLDTLITDGYIAAGTVGPDGRVSEPFETRLAVELTDNLKESIAKATASRYSIYINSAGGAHVRMYADDILTLKVIGDFEYLIKQE